MVNNGNSSRSNIAATCPAGKTLLGGGADTSSPDAWVTSSGPGTVNASGKATQWLADATETNNISNWNLSVYAICATDQ